MGQILPSAGGPAEWATSEDMDVSMTHRLASFEAGVGHEAVTGLGHALLPGHLRGEREHLRGESWVSLCHRRHIVVMVRRDDEHVHGCLGLDIAEGDRAITARDDLSGDVARADAAEEAIGHGVILA